jgi:RimJ/RimL family protein N-acetyltransferase
MRDNCNISIRGNQVVLVPYQRKFVSKYHVWMQDPQLLLMTASEPLTIEEEYAMQRSWKDDADKCTFIVLSNCSSSRASRRFDDSSEEEASVTDEIRSMVGDVNLFLNDPEDRTVAEIDVMIADPGSRRQGLGEETVSLMMGYGADRLGVRLFVAKIHETNAASLHLFRK